MATKTKAKKAPKAAAKKRAPRKRKATARKPQGVVVPNHRFAPATVVGFYPLDAVSFERGQSREPIPDPTETARVAADGTLERPGSLPVGAWLAAGPVGEGWRYFQFSVKSNG